MRFVTITRPTQGKLYIAIEHIVAIVPDYHDEDHCEILTSVGVIYKCNETADSLRCRINTMEPTI